MPAHNWDFELLWLLSQSRFLVLRGRSKGEGPEASVPGPCISCGTCRLAGKDAEQLSVSWGANLLLRRPACLQSVISALSVTWREAADSWSRSQLLLPRIIRQHFHPEETPLSSPGRLEAINFVINRVYYLRLKPNKFLWAQITYWTNFLMPRLVAGNVLGSNFKFEENY